jgi:hypothetical protein
VAIPQRKSAGKVAEAAALCVSDVAPDGSAADESALVPARAAPAAAAELARKVRRFIEAISVGES